MKTPSSAALAQATDEQRRIEEQFLRKSGGRERASALREEMQTTMEASAGIYRTESSLAAGAATLRTLQERSANLALDDHSLTTGSGARIAPTRFKDWLSQSVAA